MIGFEQRGPSCFFMIACARHALVAHAFGIEPLLPIRSFGPKVEQRIEP
jgi:hypothetical protein